MSKADEEEGLTSIGLCCACVYWHCAVGEYREAQSGECRRHPPTVRQGRIITSYNVGPDCEEDVPLTAWPTASLSECVHCWEKRELPPGWDSELPKVLSRIRSAERQRQRKAALRLNDAAFEGES